MFVERAQKSVLWMQTKVEPWFDLSPEKGLIKHLSNNYQITAHVLVVPGKRNDLCGRALLSFQLQNVSKYDTLKHVLANRSAQFPQMKFCQITKKKNLIWMMKVRR